MSIKLEVFSKLKDKYGFCSNFFLLKKPMIINGEKWNYSEQYFQAMKFRGPKAGWVLNKKTDNRLLNDLIDEYSDVQIRKDWESTVDS
jgi:predicted NAD-dependent protein-ADP-ribosyltransferase YbiA (DUF1768 family)